MLFTGNNNHVAAAFLARQAMEPGPVIPGLAGTDLSAQNAVKRQELLELWRDRRRRLGIVLPQDL